MSLARGRYDSAFVPPLQLPGGDSGQGDHVGGWELSFHF